MNDERHATDIEKMIAEFENIPALQHHLSQPDCKLVVEFADRLEAYVAAQQGICPKELHNVGTHYISKFVENQSPGLYDALMGVLLRAVQLQKYKDALVGSDRKTFEVARANVNLLQRVEELRGSQEKAQYAATHDMATGIHNKTYFRDVLPVQLEDARLLGKPISLALGDLNGFKQVNDHYGHPVGDDLLVAAFKYISHHVRDTDIFARIGGDEMAIILVGANEQQAYQRCEAIREDLNQKMFMIDSHRLKVGITFGVKQIDDSDTAEPLVQIVDNCLYLGKHLRKDCTVPYSLYADMNGDNALAAARCEAEANRETKLFSRRD